MESLYFDIDTLPGIEDSTGTWVGVGELSVKERRRNGPKPGTWDEVIVEARPIVPFPFVVIEKPVPDKTRMEEIIEAFSKSTGAHIDYLKGKSQHAGAIKLRRALAYFFRKYSWASYGDIARALHYGGCKSAMMAVQKVTARHTNPNYAAWLNQVDPFPKQ